MHYFREVKPKKTSMYIVDQILEAVRTGTYKPGDLLPPEHQLAQVFNVSRSSVREALSALKLVGVIDGRAGLGNFIRSTIGDTAFFEQVTHFLYLLREENPLEIIEARLLLEPRVAALAATNRNSDDLERCEELLKLMGENVQTGTPDLGHDSEFHILIAEMSQNGVLVDLVRDLHRRMDSESWRTFKLRSLGKDQRMAEYHQDHLSIFQAIREQDPEQAETLMRLHIEKIERGFLESHSD